MRPARPRAARRLAWLSFGLALGLLAMLAYQAGSFTNLVPHNRETSGVETNQAAQTQSGMEVTVSQSRFTGFDKLQQPFTVTAKNAVQHEDDKNKVRLVEVEAQLKRKTGDEVAIKSEKALYDAKSRTIDLNGNVIIISADGFVAKMDEARVNIDQHRLRSDVPVEVVSPSGIIRSNGMEIIDDGARILFFNRVKATFGGRDRKGTMQ
ncbi:MAG TPA: LPS export ABC transporter periplasmic protein LptC [Aestuariivirgaceae bacterium]